MEELSQKILSILTKLNLDLDLSDFIELEIETEEVIKLLRKELKNKEVEIIK